MFRRRYQMVIGRAYAQQSTNAAIPVVPESGVVLERRLDRTYYDASVKSVWRQKTREEIQAEQNAILENFVGLKGEYLNLIYDDPSSLDGLAGFLDNNNIIIEDHHVEFDVEKVGANSSEGNEGEIVLFNLSDETALLLQAIATTMNFVEFSAGYEDEPLRVIIRGNIKSAEDKFDGVDRRTKIVVTDGGEFAQNQMTTKVYPKGTPINDIVEEMIDDLALPKGNIVQLGGFGTLSKPLIVHGKSIDQLKRVLNNFGYVINIQDLFVNIYSKRIQDTVEEFLNGAGEFEARSIPLVSPDTGLLTSPAYITDTSDMTAQEISNESVTGIKFNHLLSGEFTPNAFIRLETEKFSGTYRILKVTHTGSLEGDEWFSEVEAEAVQYQTRVTPLNEQPTIEEQDLNPSDDDLTYWGIGGVGNVLEGTGGNE